jgi:hypothetical protein
VTVDGPTSTTNIDLFVTKVVTTMVTSTDATITITKFPSDAVGPSQGIGGPGNNGGSAITVTVGGQSRSPISLVQNPSANADIRQCRSHFKWQQERHQQRKVQLQPWPQSRGRSWSPLRSCHPRSPSFPHIPPPQREYRPSTSNEPRNLSQQPKRRRYERPPGF